MRFSIAKMVYLLDQMYVRIWWWFIMAAGHYCCYVHFNCTNWPAPSKSCKPLSDTCSRTLDQIESCTSSTAGRSSYHTACSCICVQYSGCHCLGSGSRTAFHIQNSSRRKPSVLAQTVMAFGKFVKCSASTVADICVSYTDYRTLSRPTPTWRTFADSAI